MLPVVHPHTLMSLVSLAGFTGVVHTVFGPDHYVPFVAMSRVGKWSYSKTLTITILCGIGHVLGSVVIGAIGVAFGIAVSGLEPVEAARGDIAAWLLLGFGVAYTAWGVHRAIRNRPHTHAHVHENGTVHAHEHSHVHDHAHAHVNEKDAVNRRMTAWMLFTVFVFGPCEPLIPILMYPAATRSWWALATVVAVFAVATIGSMAVAVTVGWFGLSRLSFRFMERYTHVAAGVALTACGVAIKIGL